MFAKRTLLSAAAVIALSTTAFAKDDLTKAAGKDWPAVGGDYGNSR